MVQEINNETWQQITTIFANSLSKSISDLIIQNSTWEKRKAVGVDELCKIFGMEDTKMYEICKKKDSPAFKIGGKTSPWMCFPDEMHKYLLKSTEKFKS